MSSHPFRSSCFSVNANSDDVLFDVSDYLALSEDAMEDPPALLLTQQHRRPVLAVDDAEAGAGRVRPVDDTYQAGRAEVEAGNAATSVRVAFRTKTELEMLDDGYKWRKYGKKKVKNSANPRNYYRCSSEGCNVKKRVERAPEDSSYLVTTYEGTHNHHAPSLTMVPPASLSSNILAAKEMQHESI